MVLVNFSNKHIKTLNCMANIYFDAYKHNKNVFRRETQLAIHERKAIKI